MQYNRSSDIIYIMPRPVEAGGRFRSPAVRLLCCFIGVAAIISSCVISFTDRLGLSIIPIAPSITARTYESPTLETHDVPDDLSGVISLEAPETERSTSDSGTPPNRTDENAQVGEPDTVCPPDALNESYAIIPVNLSRNPQGEILVDNSSGYDPDIYSLLGTTMISASTGNTSDPSDMTVTPYGDTVLYSAGTNAPAVLIVHTHGTECYSTYTDRYLDSEIGFRDLNPDHNMIAVGETMATALAENGISVLHCTIMHDKESYNNSYNYSAETIRKLIAEYPSISYVLDLHRDAVQYEDGSIARPVVETELGATAQLMLVIGTNAMGADHPNWQSNLSLGLKLQSVLNSDSYDIARPISLRGAAYNQQYTPGSLLVEVGACGNTLEEAKRAAILFADALSAVIFSQQ